MNEGTLAMLIQWCMLCLVWMGSFDRLAREIGMSRRRLLAVIAGFLLCSFASWKLSFAPAQIGLSGTLLPILVCCWLYGRMSLPRRRIHLFAALAMSWLLFWLRWVFFTDPALLFWDVRVLLPVAAVMMALIVNRNALLQLFSLLLSLVVADVINGLFFWKWSGACHLGSEYAQDLLWSSLSFWSLLHLLWLAIRRLTGWNNADPSNSEDA